MADSLKIASWNINSVRARIELVEKFLREEAPDILCLQETKVIDSLFPAGIFRQLGYNHIVLHGQLAHHGVAIVSRVPIRQDERLDWQDNGEARHLGVALPNGWRLNNVYVPAGGEEPDEEVNSKFGQKLAFVRRMIEWSKTLDQPTILTGDFNIAPLASDVWSSKQLKNVVSHTAIELQLLGEMKEAAGWIDLAREFIPDPERCYTWWSYRARDWAASDRGRRLDHMWATPDIREKAIAHKVHEPCRSWVRPSDHVPIVTEFRL